MPQFNNQKPNINQDIEFMRELLSSKSDDLQMTQKEIYKAASFQVQFKLSFVEWGYELFFLADECCEAVRFRKNHYFNKYVKTGKADTLPGFHRLLEGEKLEQFKKLYEKQTGKVLERKSPMWAICPVRMIEVMSPRVLDPCEVWGLFFDILRESKAGNHTTAARLQRKLDKILAALDKGKSLK